MSMFRKPKKSIQRRVFSILDDEDENNKNESIEFNENSEIKDLIESHENEVMDFKEDMSKKKKNKIKGKSKEVGRTLLSFEDDDDNIEVFKVKKSSHSKKVMRQLDKERKRKKKQITSDAPTDQIDLQDNGRIKIQTDDLEIILKQTEPNLILNGQAAMAAGKDDLPDDEEESDQPFHRFSYPEAVKDALERGKIPDAAMIHAARKKRQKAREMGDYIPLPNSEQVSKGRLVREDGDGDGSDEDADRVDMSLNIQNKDRAERSEKFYEAQDMMYNKESDPELEEWENQQIRKGVTGAQVGSGQQESVYQFFVQAPQEDHYKLNPSSQLRQAYASAGIAPFAQSKPIITEDRTLKDIEDCLSSRLNQIHEAHSVHIHSLNHLAEDIMNLKINLEAAENKAPEYKRQFKFYQEMRSYIADLVECLDKKLPCIVNCEQRALMHMHAQTMYLIERRRQDIRDQADSDKVQVRNDEKFLQRSAEREGRRARRRRIREKNNIQQSHAEGMSSDDEIPDQHLLADRQQMEIILSDASEIFSDTADEFASMKGVLDCFEQWQSEDSNIYNEAYVTLCLPKIIGPYIRLELVNWNPLKTNNDLEKMEWYKTMALYGLSKHETETDLQSNDISMLIPMVIEKIILPKLIEVIQLWDPISTSETLKLVSLMTKLCKDYPRLRPSCKALVMLLETIIERIKWAIDNDVYIPLVMKQTEFSQRQFAGGVKLLHNILSFQGVLNDTKLMHLAFGSLLNRYLVPIIRICKSTEAAEKIYLITNTLPRVWLQGSCLKELDPLKECVVNISNQLSKSNVSHSQSIETTNLVMKTLHI